MKLIQMKSLPRVVLLFLFFCGDAGFLGELANGEEHKAVEKFAMDERKEKTTALAPAIHCLVDSAALEDLKRQKDDLEERKREIVSKESDLKTREQVVVDELRGLEKIRDEISQITDKKAKEKEARVAKLVEMFLTMSPKSAAKVLAGLDDSLAVLTISQMDSLHLAKIMNNMDPVRSSHLSELLAGVKLKHAPVIAKKGGA
jgi:flagellar motility protein MotE (MotC chaperone)